MEIKHNRWVIVLGAVLLQVCVGAIYTWSLFNKPLSNNFGWQESEIVFAFAITVFMFAFATIFSGRLQDKKGPKLVARIGGGLYGLGLILSSTATTLIQLYIFYGVIVGLGVGFVYVCPLSTCLKWFPDKKGLITGISLGAFGLGGLVFKPFIEISLRNFGTSATFLYQGILFFVLIQLGAQLLKLPPEGYISKTVNINQSPKKDYTVMEMVRTPSFYYLWVLLLLGATSGLLVIGLATDIGIQYASLDATTAATAVSVVALFNTAGRLILGWLSDKIGRIKVVFLTFVMTAVSMLYISFFSLNLYTFMITVAFITFSFGGLMAVYPTVTGDFYGLKNIGANYGLMFQAYGLSALVGPTISANVGDLKTAFAIIGGLSIIGAVMCLRVKKP